MTVFDASALLAFLQGEAGADVVESALESGGGVVGAATWAEVAQKVRSRQADLALALALLTSYSVAVEPVTREDAERAAVLWTRSSPLSLGDRLCLALGHRLGVQVLTADSAWGTDGRIVQIR